MDDGKFKESVAELLVGIAFSDLTKVEKAIFRKLETMKVLSLDEYGEIRNVYGPKLDKSK